MRLWQRLDLRPIIFAALATAFGVWSLVMLAPLSAGTLQRVGPAMVPRFCAIALVVAGLLIAVRAATGIAAAPPRLLPGPLRFALALLLLLILLVPNIAMLVPDVPPVAFLADGLQQFMLMAGPGDILALIWLRWTLAILIGVVIAGDGLLTGLASMLIGCLLGLAGEDINSGGDRLPQLATLLETYGFALELGIVVVMILCRVNPLPAAFAYISAPIAAEQFARVMLLSRGTLLPALGRPIAIILLSVIVVIAVALVWYRWPWRARAAWLHAETGL